MMVSWRTTEAGESEKMLALREALSEWGFGLAWVLGFLEEGRKF